MVRRPSLQDIREQTYKVRDAWWTVLLVDPLAARLVRLVAPYRWITPNLLTVVAMLLGVGSAACFLAQDRGWLMAGAVLFHLSFVVDCMDGKIARLNGTGSMFGTWFDFMFDRLRVFMCAAALFGGQYARTGHVAFLWTLVVVTFLDLFRYLNSQQLAKTRQSMRDLLEEARGPAPEEPVAGTLLVAFEVLLIVKLWRATRGFPVALAAAQATAALRLPPTVRPETRGEEFELTT